MDVMTEPFMPAWAELELAGKDHAAAEIKLHREFFEAWETLHSIPNDRMHRNKAERAAQQLVDLAQTIKRMRQPAGRVLNG